MRKITFVLCLAFLVFNSCEKENIIQEEITQEQHNRKGILETVLEQGQGKLGGGFLVVVLEQGHGRIPGAYLISNHDEPIHFQIDSQEPCDVLDVNPDTGRLSLLNDGITGLCGNYDDAELSVQYSVINVGGEIESHSFVLSAEDFIIIDFEED